MTPNQLKSRKKSFEKKMSNPKYMVSSYVRAKRIKEAKNESLDVERY